MNTQDRKIDFSSSSNYINDYNIKITKSLSDDYSYLIDEYIKYLCKDMRLSLDNVNRKIYGIDMDETILRFHN